MGTKEKKPKKKETQRKAPVCEAYIERIKVLEKEIEAYRKDGEKLGEEILALRRSVASYKSARTVRERRIKELEKQVEHNRAVDVEGDHLYEEALSSVESMKKTIQGLTDQVLKLSEENNEFKQENERMELELMEEKSKPWWKKIF